MADSFTTAAKLRLATSPDFSTWTAYADAIVRGCVFGSALAAGSATADVPWGDMVAMGGSVGAVSQPVLSNLAALWCRIEEETAPATWTPRWWGRVTGGAIQTLRGSTPTGGVTTLQLEDLNSLLGRRLLTNAKVEAAGGGLIDLYRWPRIGGNRSAATTTVNSKTVYVPTLSPGNGSPWRADYLIASAFAHAWPTTWPAYSIAAAGVAFPTYEVPDIEVWGRSLADLLAALVGPDRGLSWKLDVSGSTIQINLQSLLQTAVTIGSVTTPANNSQSGLDLSTDATVLDLSGEESWSQVADEVIATTEPGEVGITLKYVPANTGSLRQGWTASPTDPDRYRKFTIPSTWDGLSDTALGGLEHALTITSGEFTGARATGSTPANGVELDASLPYPQGTTSFSSPTAIDRRKTRQDAILIIEWASGVYEDVSDRVKIRVGGPNTIYLGDGPDDLAQVTLWATNAVAMYLSLTAYEWAPTTVSKVNASPVTDRQVLLRVPGDEARMAKEMLLSTTGAALTRASASGVVLRSQSAALQALAGQMASQRSPQVRLRWRKAGLSTAHAPLSMVYPMTATGLAATAAPVVLQRAWRQRGAGWETEWTAASRVIDAGGIE